MKIAVDLDDVVVDFSRHILACWKTEYGQDIDYDALTWSSLLDGTHGPTWAWLRTRDWLWAKAPAVEGALGGIQQLRDAGHMVEALTKKPDWARWTVWAWCGKWRPPFDTLTVVPSGHSKADCSTADVLVDDSPDNIKAWTATGRTGIVFDRPWNRDLDTDRLPGLRAANWQEVLDLLSYINKEEAA